MTRYIQYEQQTVTSLCTCLRLLFMMAMVNLHSPGRYHGNGPVQNIDAFYKAFNVQPGYKMYKPENERIKVWQEDKMNKKSPVIRKLRAFLISQK